MRRDVVIAGLVAIGGVPSAAPAQCKPPKDSNEAKLLAFYEAPTAFTPMIQPAVRRPGTIIAGAEIVPVPNPSSELQRTGVCFLSKSENTDLAPVFGRPRILVELTRGLTLEASYVPPIKIADAEPHLGSVALSWTRSVRTSAFGGDPVFAARAHSTFGRVRGPITCPREALQQTSAAAPCYGTTPSKDTFEPNMFGVEGVLGWGTRIPRLSGYVGAGVNWLRPRFQVGFTTSTGTVDTTRVEVDLTRGAFFSGVNFHVTPLIDAALQIHSVPTDVTTVRFGVAYRAK